MFSISAICRRSPLLLVRRRTGTVSRPGLLSGTPAALAGDQLVAAVRQRADDQRLDDAGLGEAMRRAAEIDPSSKRLRGCSGFGRISSTGTSPEQGLAELAGLGQDRGEPRPIPRFGCDSRQRPTGG